MTVDHIGVFLGDNSFFAIGTAPNIVGSVFRSFGRLAFPLFILMLSEGLHKSKDRLNYLLRLAVVWAVITVVEVGISFAKPDLRLESQAFTDLLMFASFIYFLEHPKKGLRWLAILPLGYIVFSFAAGFSEGYAYMNGQISVWTAFFPQFLRCAYSLYGFLMFLGMYYAPTIVKWAYRTMAGSDGVDLSEWTTGPKYQGLLNVISSASIIVFTLIFWMIERMTFISVYNMGLQSYCIAACLLIACYTGARGWDRKWFRYFQYLYYPVHLCFIYLVFALFF